jgi:ATP-dependent RNA helicase RhlB
VLELAYEHMNEPEKITVESEFITNAKVRQLMYLPADDEKLPLLLGLLSRSEGARTMVFVNTKAFVERVARALERSGYRVGVLSGDVPQKKRETLLNKFQKGQLEILVATDVAARGLHIDGVSHVYNYDLPFDAEDYVHRIGRTARLGAEGDAISFACERYAQGLPDIEAYIEQKIPVEPITAELLIAQPRKPREGVEADAAEGESVGEIFREAREQRAADEQRRGGRSGSGGRSSGGRSSAPASRGPRAERAPRPARKPDAPNPVVTPVAAAAAGTASTDEAARKRRRRRRGKPVEGAAAESMAPAKQASAQVVAKRVPQPGGNGGPAPERGASPSLLSRIKRRLESIVTRGPRSQH